MHRFVLVSHDRWRGQSPFEVHSTHTPLSDAQTPRTGAHSDGPVQGIGGMRAGLGGVPVSLPPSFGATFTAASARSTSRSREPWHAEVNHAIPQEKTPTARLTAEPGSLRKRAMVGMSPHATADRHKQGRDSCLGARPAGY